MKAWQLSDTKGIGSYQLNEVEEPEPGPDEVRIKVSHSALNHLDLWVSQGLPPQSISPTSEAPMAQAPWMQSVTGSAASTSGTRSS